MSSAEMFRPASTSNTFVSGFSERRAAKTHPALPPPKIK
jgi:hypothetical protein